MTPLELKAIKHCAKIIGETSPHEVYSKVNDALNQAGCSTAQAQDVLRVLEKSQFALLKPIIECKDWLTELLKS